MTASTRSRRRSHGRSGSLVALARCLAEQARRIEMAGGDELALMPAIVDVAECGEAAITAAIAAELVVLAPVARWAVEGDVALPLARLDAGVRAGARDTALRDAIDTASTVISDHLSTIAPDETDRLDTLARVVEPMLAARDATARRAHGAWYTPGAVARFQLARADSALREAGVDAGLLAPGVRIVDPACGTGVYVSAWLSMRDELVRLRGTPARGLPPVAIDIALLPATVARFNLRVATDRSRGDAEQPVVICRDALAIDSNAPEIAAAHLVVIGNPPYRVSGLPGARPRRSTADADDALEPYRRGLLEDFGVRKTLITDAYIRFIRQTERWLLDAPTAAEPDAVRVGCLITNANWLDGLAFPAMRRHLAQRFDHIGVDYLGGGRHDTQGGNSDPMQRDGNIFTDGESPGIARAVAIATFVRRGSHGNGDARATIGWTAWHGDAPTKLAAIADAATAMLRERATLPARYESTPSVSARDGYRLGPMRVGAPSGDARSAHATDSGASWVPLDRCFAYEPMSGYQPGRGDTFRAFDRDALAAAMQAYLDDTLGHDDVVEHVPLAAGLFKPQAGGFEQPTGVRVAMLAERAPFDPALLRRYLAFPFDARWLYDDARLLHRRRPALTAAAAIDGNAFLCACPRVRTRDRLGYAIVSELPPGYYAFESHARAFAKWVRGAGRTRSGIAPWLVGRLRNALGVDAAAAVDVAFAHIAAVVLAPSHQRACDMLRGVWPAVPIPCDGERLRASAEVGARAIAAMRPGPDVALRSTAVRGHELGAVPDAVQQLRIGGYSVWRHWRQARKHVVCDAVMGETVDDLVSRLTVWMEEILPALDENARALMALPPGKLIAAPVSRRGGGGDGDDRAWG